MPSFYHKSSSLFRWGGLYYDFMTPAFLPWSDLGFPYHFRCSLSCSALLFRQGGDALLLTWWHLRLMPSSSLLKPCLPLMPPRIQSEYTFSVECLQAKITGEIIYSWLPVHDLECIPWPQKDQTNKTNMFLRGLPQQYKRYQKRWWRVGRWGKRDFCPQVIRATPSSCPTGSQKEYLGVGTKVTGESPLVH